MTEIWKPHYRDLRYSWNQFFFLSIICSTNIDSFVEQYRVQKVSMLREICKKTGVQIMLKEYDFDTRKNTTFSDDDILNIFPVVKSITPRASDATNIFEAAQTRLQSGTWRFFTLLNTV